jgi:hypothetical protein
MVPKSGKHLSTSQRVTNRRFKEATGWCPTSPSVREGWAKVVGELNPEPSLRPLSRVLLWLLAFNGLALGGYAQFFPRAFYDDFPSGRHWVSIDGPYNEHLVRDFGAMNLAMGVVAIGAVLAASLVAARIAAAAWVVFSVPHFVYHLRHLQHYETADKVGNVTSLGFAVLLALVALWSTFRRSPDPTATPVDEVDLRPTPARV